MKKHASSKLKSEIEVKKERELQDLQSLIDFEKVVDEMNAQQQSPKDQLDNLMTTNKKDDSFIETQLAKRQQ